jgi:two-component system, chemotaxis family, protein-glutamate methylesterase/glutaminase
VATPDLEHESEHEPAHMPSEARLRVLVVDDSALMRRLLSDLLSSAPEIEIIGTARDGREAVLQAVRLKPDVITLDVEMPEVSGLEALPTLLAVQDGAVVMVSALTQEGADVTLQALELGAVDFVPKPEHNQLTEMRANRDLLVGKVLAAAQSRGRRRRHAPAPGLKSSVSSTSSSARTATPLKSRRLTSPRVTATTAPAPVHSPACFVIGISTGGPQALSQIFPLLSPPLPPIVVVQHMLVQFTGIFAERLNRYSPLTIKQAEEGDLMLPDRVLIAPGGQHMNLTGHPPRVRVALSDEPPVRAHRPSIDVLFQSAARVYQAAVIGLLMTGMGRDGVEGCKAILAAGGFTFGQDEDTSVVYGMNKAAFLEGAIKAQFALDELPGILQKIAALHGELESPSNTDS